MKPSIILFCCRESGPLMVSPTGQFIVPSSLPGFLLVSFITTHLKDAKEKMVNYKKFVFVFVLSSFYFLTIFSIKHLEHILKDICIKELQLDNLLKGDSVTPDLMIQCCERLLSKKSELHQLKNVNLNITTYYSVLSDGSVCIPWNWKL